MTPGRPLTPIRERSRSLRLRDLEAGDLTGRQSSCQGAGPLISTRSSRFRGCGPEVVPEGPPYRLVAWGIASIGLQPFASGCQQVSSHLSARTSQSLDETALHWNFGLGRRPLGRLGSPSLASGLALVVE